MVIVLELYSRVFLKNSMKGKFSQWAGLSQAHGYSLCPMERWPVVYNYSNSWAVGDGLASGQGLGTNKVGTLATRRSGERYVDGPLRMDTEHECNICAHVNASQRTAIEEEGSNNQLATQHECLTCQQQRLNPSSGYGSTSKNIVTKGQQFALPALLLPAFPCVGF